MSGEHWFDRLAEPHTRRHTLKSALVAAALTLPLVRSVSPAGAANRRAESDPHACQRGCLYASHRQYKARDAGCNRFPKYEPLFELAFLGTGYLGVFKSLGFAIAELDCAEYALLEQRGRNRNCYYDNCPGFDPAGVWGPCRNCASIPGCLCCPDSSSATGYSYCSSLSGYCCKPGGGCIPCVT